MLLRRPPVQKERRSPIFTRMGSRVEDEDEADVVKGLTGTGAHSLEGVSISSPG